MSTPQEIRERLEHLRSQLRAECISWDELHELQSLADHIEPGDVELLEPAGVPEFPEDTPDELLTLYDAGCQGRADVDMRELLWAILRDAQDSYERAMEGAGIEEDTRTDIRVVVNDYLANHYGDD